jgi:hypothetical protein
MSSFAHRSFVVIASLGFLLLGACQSAVRISVPADAPIGLPTVVGVPVARSPLGGAESQAWDARADANVATIAQFVAGVDDHGRVERSGALWMPMTVQKPERGRTYELTLSKSDKQAGVLHMKTIPNRATEIYAGDRLVLRYNHGPEDPNGVVGGSAVIGYVHPVTDLDGNAISDNSPPDHHHHRGIFWAWPRLRRGDESRGDWWTLNDVRYRFGRICQQDCGPVIATITTEGYWDYQTPSMKRPDRLVRELATIRVFAPTEDFQLIDFDIRLFGVGQGVSMAGQSNKNKGYGGFTFRFAPAKEVQITADGKAVPDDEDMYRTRWADYSAEFKDAPASGREGAAILTHPSHPGNPPGWCLRPYGILDPSYPGLDFVSLSPSKPLRFQYRVVIHRGDAEHAHIGELYRLYAASWSNVRQSL